LRVRYTSAVWKNLGDHAGPVATRGDSEGRTGGP
jgi:hypothetical protein